jgi:hypothetical integral membrane protein (TIGR02206 family)
LPRPLRPYALALAIGSPFQVLVLALVAITAVATCAAVRLRPGAWVRPFTVVLAVLLVASEASWWTYAVVRHLPLAVALPLQICDVAPLVAAVALLWRWPPAVEVAYFWGAAGCSLALLTPDLPDRFPSFLFAQYVVEHGLAVVAALLLPIGLGLNPRRGAVLRVTLATAALAVVAGVADILTGGNYMYLARPPASPTLLAVLGAWPWYLAGGTVIAVLILVLLDLPFRLTYRPRRREPSIAGARATPLGGD